MPPATVQPAAAGDPRRIGDFRIIGRLGAGGMGVVYAGIAPDGTRVAVKQIRLEYAADPAFRARFTREVALTSRVSGPCIVPLLAADTQAAQPWLATPYIPGPTLDAYLAQHGPLTGAPLLALAVGTAGALAAIHAAGVIHRDLKPSNVILSPASPKVVDFGIAHAAEATAITRTGAWTGTPGWTSPEQYQGADGGPASDVFTWGALIAYAATGRLPFGTGRPDTLAYRIISGDPDLEGVPDPLLAHLDAALAKSPRDRPSAEGLAEHLVVLLAGEQTALIQPAAPTREMPAALRLDQAVTQAWALPSPVVDTPWYTGTRPRRRTGVWVGAGIIAASGAVAALLAGLPATSHPSVQAQHSGSATTSTSPTAPAATARTTAATTTPAAPGGSSPANGPAAAGCVQVTYKLSGGPSSCKSTDEVCALGAPWYTTSIDTVCGAPPVARVYVTDTDRIRSGACLVLNSTTWATATTSYNAAGTPAASCSASVDRTQNDAGGQPLTACQDLYPDTRLTFLAQVTTVAGATTTACLTAEAGA